MMAGAVMADPVGVHVVSADHASGASMSAAGSRYISGELATIKDRVVIEPESPVTVLLTSGREIHALRFHEAHTGDADEPVIVVDANEYVYIIAQDVVAAVIVKG